MLISAAAGYWVLAQSEKEKSKVKKLGQLLGVVIIVVSLFGAACKIYGQVSNCSSGKMGGKFCPFTGRPMGGAPVSDKSSG